MERHAELLRRLGEYGHGRSVDEDALIEKILEKGELRADQIRQVDGLPL